MLVYNIRCLENEFPDSLGDVGKSNHWLGRPSKASDALAKWLAYASQVAR